MYIGRLRALLYLLTAASLLTSVFGDSLLASLSVTLCGFVYGIQDIIGILALALFLVGGSLYSLAHFIPTSVDFRKSMLGWATALIIGGLIGLIVVVLAQPIVNLIAGFTIAAGGTGTIGIGCA